MFSWTLDQQQKFLEVYADLWPTSPIAKDPAKHKELISRWIENLSFCDVQIAIQALRDTKDSEQIAAPPAIKVVRDKAAQIHGKLRQWKLDKVKEQETRSMSPQEFAESPWWIGRLSKASQAERRVLLKIRQGLRKNHLAPAEFIGSSVGREREPGDDG